MILFPIQWRVLAPLLALSGSLGVHTAEWDNFSDTWILPEAQGKSAASADGSAPRADRTVAMFYFLWLGPHANQGGPWDITKILAKDRDAMQKPDSPLWGPMFAPHHWGESIFGYYNSDDPYVLKKHAQMLSDAGVDLVVFDVTNQLTYKENYMALLRAWAEVRALGNKAPQIAFLCPFWDPARVARELYRDLYQPGLGSDLWFRWNGKPLILADPDRIGSTSRFAKRDYPAERTEAGTLGQTFTATNSFIAVAPCVPTWRSRNSSVTLRLLRDGPGGPLIAEKEFNRVEDNAWLTLNVPRQNAGVYYLEMTGGTGTLGWWSHHSDVMEGGQAFASDKVVPGDRNIEITWEDSTTREIRHFFTFRTPQPDYFRGPTRPDMWSWLEVYPQHVFINAPGEKEEMSVGVAQNAVSNRLGSMSEPASRGRSYHAGRWEPDPDAVNQGYNFAEQFERALREDPKVLFITGWNEWIAGRHPEFNGIRHPVMFVDEFDQEHSRDIEPMKGGHADRYYYQLVNFVRRYKGVRKTPPPGAPKSIDPAGGFDAWNDVTPEFRDDAGDTVHRDFAGYANHRRYTNNSGRNDIVVTKVSRDAESVYFYVRTREPFSPRSEPGWMWLLIDADASSKTGWEGYDLLVNRKVSSSDELSVERHAAGWSWNAERTAKARIAGREMQLAIPRKWIQSDPRAKLKFHFKWADNMREGSSIDSWVDAGDTAPNGRFSYLYEEP